MFGKRNSETLAGHFYHPERRERQLPPRRRIAGEAVGQAAFDPAPFGGPVEIDEIDQDQPAKPSQPDFARDGPGGLSD